MQIQAPPDNLSTREKLHLVLFTLFCFLSFTYNLSEVPPYHADENFYVTSTRNMVNSGDYITPMYHSEKRFAKPILFYWLVAISYKTFGVDLFSARLVSSFFGSLCIPLIYIIAQRIFDRKTALISALILPGCYLHFQIARWAITDMTLNFFILATFYFFIRGSQDKLNKGTSYYLAYLCMGLGFMIKGPLAIAIPALVIGGFIFILRDWEKLSQLRIGYGIAILSIIILPWFIIMLAIHGNEFKNHILGAELRDRIVHDIPFSLYYFGVTIRYFLPWSFFFIAAIVVKFQLISTTPREPFLKKDHLLFLPNLLKVSYHNMTLKDNQPFLFSLLWVACPLLLFTLFRIEHSRYMLPASPALAMITAHFLSKLIDSPGGLNHKTFKVPFYLTIIFYILIVGLIGIGVFILRPSFTIPFGLTVLSTLALFGSVLLFILYKSRKYFSMIVSLSVVQVIFLTALSGNVLPFFNRYPMKIFANQILADSQTNKRIGLYQLGNHRARMGVLTGLPSINLNNPEELKLFLESERNTYVVMRQSDWQHEFSSLQVIIQATDSGWEHSRVNKDTIGLLLKDWPNSPLLEHSKVNVLLKGARKK